MASYKRLKTGSSTTNRIPDAKRLSPKILQLPRELWDLVLNNLPLSDLFHLNQTCRAFRCLGRPHWKQLIFQESITPAQREQFFLQLSHVLLVYQAFSRPIICRICGSLHKMNGRDIPHNRLSGNICSKLEWRLESPVLILRESSGAYGRRMPGPVYKLRQTHVQMAHRIHRLGANATPDARLLLGDMMKPLWHRSCIDPSVFNSSVRCMLSMQSYNRYPSSRFLVRTQETHPNDLLNWLDYRICPHLWIPCRVIANGKYDNSFQADFGTLWLYSHRDSMSQKGWEAPGSCHSCATDYHIAADSEIGGIKSTAWRDFGEEMSAQDRRWKSMEISPIIQYVSHKSRNGLATDGVRKLWEENIRQFQKIKANEDINRTSQGGYYAGELEETGK